MDGSAQQVVVSDSPGMALMPQDFEPVARVLAATVLAQSLSYSLRRQYLEDCGDLGVTDTPLLQLRDKGSNLSPVTWLKVDQVGLPANNDLQGCMISLERILQAAHVPDRHQLIFLTTGDGVRNQMYLGLRPISHDFGCDCEEAVEVLADFGAANWPGLHLKPCSKEDAGLGIIPELLADGHFGIVALTGLPSMRKGTLTTYPATLDKLMGALRGKRWAYLVVADSLRTANVDGLLNACRDLAGRAEAMKAFNFSESIQIGQSQAFSEAKSEFENWSHSQSRTGNEWLSGKTVLGVVKLIGAGALLADIVAPPLGTLARAMGELGTSGMEMGLGLAMNALIPTTTEGKTIGGGKGTQKGFTKTYSDSQSKSLSHSCVNKHMEAVAEILNHHIARFEQSQALGYWQVGAYLIAEDQIDAQSCGRLVRSLVSGEDSYHEPVRLHQLPVLGREALGCSLKYFERPDIVVVTQNGILPHPFGKHYQRLLTPMNTRELTMLVNLPTRAVPGIDVIEVPEEASQKAKPVGPNSIVVGNQLYAGSATQIPYPLDVEQLAMHALACGINDSGKSNTCRHILHELLRRRSGPSKKNIPFLVIEPVKDEYVEWALKINQGHPNTINVFMPGRRTWNGQRLGNFTLNPFDIVLLDENIEHRVLEHIDRLKTILIATLPMQEVLPVLMEELVYRVYMTPLKMEDDNSGSQRRAPGQHYKWLPTDLVKDRLALPQMRRPTFTQLRNHIELVIAEKGYNARLSNDLKATLMTRIDGYLRGWRASVLNQGKPNPDFWRILFDQPTVINLSALTSDDDKMFFMAVLLQFLYEYRQAQHETERKSQLKTPTLRHLMVVEEAHRILCNDRSRRPLTANPMAKVAEMFSNMISEVRSYGQGILLVDQIPVRLNPDVIKNTNLKIVHRLVAGDDRQMMAVCLDLKPSHQRLLGSLGKGQALIRSDMDNDAAWIQVQKSEIG